MGLPGHLVLLGTQFRDFSGIGYKYSKLQHYPHIKPHYGAKAQYSEATDDSPLLSKQHTFPPGSHWYPIVLCKGSEPNYAYCNRLHCDSASQPQWTNDAKIQSIIRLCGLTSRFLPHIPSQWDGPCRSHKRLVLLRNKGPYQSRWKFIYAQQHNVYNQQWRSVHDLQNHKGRHVFGSRCWSGTTVLKLQGIHTSTPCTGINGA